MLKTTLGQLLINETLPNDMRNYNRMLDKKGVGDLMQELAEKYPEKYREVAKQISDVGRDTAYSTGGYSFGLKDMRAARVAVTARKDMTTKIQSINAHPQWSDDRKEEEIIKVVGKYQDTLADDILEESLAEGNPLAFQLKGAGRGNKMSLKSLRGGDLLYTDHHGNIVPIPVVHSYSEGLRPVEYWAGTFGARKGLADVKFATQDAGFFSKQLNQAAHRLIITALDDDKYDPAQIRGLPVDVSDPDNEGALLAMDTEDYPRNTILTPKMLKELERKGHDQILVRSPLVGGTPEGGLYARDVGIRERGSLAPVGDYVGLAAAQALSEPIAQSQLESKHTGGVAGTGKRLSGFQYVNQLVQVPKVFKGGAAHAQVDGRVSDINPAPQGGTYVTIEGERHYVAKDFDLKIEKGDMVEAGDIISEGLPNPAQIVEHKGVGEGKRYFVKAFQSTFKDFNMSGHRRNMELLARGLINHVRLTEEMGHWVPDDIVPYNVIERDWKPREGSRLLATNSAKGKYLERPILHYSIGTRVRPSVIQQLQKFGVKNIDVHDEPPPFMPEMVRGMANTQHDPDWMTRFLGSGLQRSLLKSVHRGGTSDLYGTSYVPALAARTEFGREGLTKGWVPSTQQESIK